MANKESSPPRRRADHRRRSRVFALQVMYQWEVRNEALADIFDTFWTDSDAPEVEREYTRLLVGAVFEGMDERDRRIASVSEHWQLPRIAVLDRNLLRLAVAETESLDTPVKVVINEAIEIAKMYSTERSGEFINGVLDRLLIRNESKTHENQVA